MKLVFKKSIREKLNEMILKAREDRLEIEKILLTKEEMIELGKCIRPFWCRTPSEGDFYCGIPLDVDNEVH